jgi:ABC-2 type transport system permease protein
MFHLIRLEWLKIRRYRAFWILLMLYAVSFAGIVFASFRFYKKFPLAATFILGNPFKYPVYWDTVAYFGSMALVIPAIIIIMLTCNEYSYRTHRQNVIDGWSRTQFISAKWLMVLLLSIFSTLCYMLATVISGLIVTQNPGEFLSGDWYRSVGFFFYTALIYTSFALLVAILVRRSGFAIGIYVLYAWLFDNVLYFIFEYAQKNKLGRFLPFESVDGLLPNTLLLNIPQFGPLAYQLRVWMFIASLGYLVLFVALTYRIVRRRDL